MRWSGQLIDDGDERGADTGEGQIALFTAGSTIRTFDTPEFRGATFYEVQAKSVLNRVAGQSPMFRWTVNPYRGCGHRWLYSTPWPHSATLQPTPESRWTEPAMNSAFSAKTRTPTL
ncbi:MAG TPA: hypothetical protein VGX23_33810 [Actinocrinis sp.]|nr:hypothetical protein [Actinocrinis sp.]